MNLRVGFISIVGVVVLASVAIFLFWPIPNLFIDLSATLDPEKASPPEVAPIYGAAKNIVDRAEVSRHLAIRQCRWDVLWYRLLQWLIPVFSAILAAITARRGAVKIEEEDWPFLKKYSYRIMFLLGIIITISSTINANVNFHNQYIYDAYYRERFDDFLSRFQIECRLVLLDKGGQVDKPLMYDWLARKSKELDELIRDYVSEVSPPGLPLARATPAPGKGATPPDNPPEKKPEQPKAKEKNG
jgi:hypothetical protein